ERVEEDLSLPFRVDAEELSLHAGGDGEVAVREKSHRPDVRLLRFEKRRRLAVVWIDAIDLAVRRGARVERAIVKGDAVDLLLRRGVENLQFRAAQPIDLPAVAGAEEAIAVRRSRLREDERIGERRELPRGRPGAERDAR